MATYSPVGRVTRQSRFSTSTPRRHTALRAIVIGSTQPMSTSRAEPSSPPRMTRRSSCGTWTRARLFGHTKDMSAMCSRSSSSRPSTSPRTRCSTVLHTTTKTPCRCRRWEAEAQPCRTHKSSAPAALAATAPASTRYRAACRVETMTCASCMDPLSQLTSHGPSHRAIS